MKSTIKYLLFTVIVFTSNAFSQVPNYVPTNGLVGYWPFNSNANDESGNNLNQTVIGSQLTSDRYSASSKAYSFNGSGDYMESATAPILNTIQDDLTISGWIFLQNAPSAVEGGAIVARRDFVGNPTGERNHFQFYVTGNRELCFSFNNNTNPTLYQGLVQTPINSVPVGEWSHVSVMFSNGLINIYINGSLTTSQNLGFKQLPVYNHWLNFGRVHRSQGNSFFAEFPGKIDDIGIWNRALTQQEITNLYTSTVPVSCLPAYVPTSGLVGYWPFCGNANDESGNGNNGTVNGAMLTNDRNGISNSCYDYNGISNQITIPNSLSLNPSEISINVWIYALSDNLENLEKGNVSNASNHGYAITHNDGWQIQRGLKSSFGDGTCSITTNTVWSDYNIFINNEWVMITVSIDNLGIIKHYKNGNLIYTSSNNSPLNSCNNPASTLRFGGPHWNNDPEWFLGKIDDIGIWNRVLTQQEITNLYTSTVSPTVAILSGDATICAGAATNLSVAVTGGTAPYTVTVTDGTNIYSATGASPVSIPVSPTSTSTYTIVSVTGGGTGTGNTGTAIVTVIDATISASDSVICAGDSVTLSVPQGGYSNTACAAPPTNLQSGLVGYWPFCGNANDESGNGNNGTVNGATLSTDRFGSANSSYSFDGVNQYIATESAQNQIQEKTFCAWVKLSNVNQSGGGIVSIQTPSGSMFDAMVYNELNNGWFFGSEFLSRSSTSNYMESDTQQWVHMVFTYQSVNFKMYRNGTLIYTDNQFQSYQFNSDAIFLIGLRHYGSNGYFNGKIDDVAIYNRSLSASEIQQLYTLGQTTYLWSTGATTPAINVTPTQTTTYTCTVTDANGNACTNSVTVVVNNPTINLGNDVTACGTSTTLTAPAGFDSYLWSNGATTNTTTVNVNGTYSCTVTQGLCSARDSIDVTFIDATITASDSTICVGETTTLSVPQGGSSNTACAALPTNLQTGLVGYWPFCGNANDASGNENNGTVNGATLTADRFGSANSAYSFDGSDWIEILDSPSIRNSNFTISCWVYGTDFNGFNQVISKNIGSSNNESINLVISNSSIWNVTAQAGGNGFYGTIISSQSLFDLNNWHFIVYSYTGQDNIQSLWIDGEMIASNISMTNIEYDSRPLTFGAQLEFGLLDYFFNGNIDDISIHNRALSATEVQQLYTLGQSTYLWSNGATTPTINVSPTSTSTYTCTTTTNGVSCTDSITVVVNNPTIDLGNDVTVCGPSTTLTAPTGFDSYFWSNGATTNTTTVTANGTYACTVTQDGCSASDSIDVVLVPLTTNTTPISACNSYVWNGTTYTASGVYTGTTSNCVTESLNLIITPSSTNTTTISSCGPYTWVNNGQTYTQSGVYTGTSANCVTQSLNLTIIPATSTGSVTTSICTGGSYIWPVNGQTYTTAQSGITIVTGCNTATLNLTITPNSINTTTASACTSLTWNGTTYTASGVYTGATANCVTQSLNLTINPSSTNTTTISSCGTYTWGNNGQTYTSSGVYSGTTANCVTQSLNLTIIPNTSVTTTINANDTYTWVANGLTYTTSGIYTGPTSANCVTQYLNLTINSSGLSEEELELFSLYPNPVSDMLYVNLNGQDKQEYLIIDNFGSVVKRGVLENMSTEISVSELSAGLYYFKIAGTKPRKFSKIN